MTMLFASAASPVRPATAPRPTAPAAPTNESMPTDQVTRAQFAALMALLAGGDSRVRGELTKQLPADRAVLVEQLLARTSSAAPDGVRTDVAAVRLFDGASETNAHALLAQLMAAQASRGSAEGAMAADRLPMNRRSTDQLLMDARPVDRVGTDRPLMGTQPMDRVATERSPMDQRPTGQLLSNRPLLDARLAEPHVALELQRSTPSAPFVAIPRGAERPISPWRVSRARGMRPSRSCWRSVTKPVPMPRLCSRTCWRRREPKAVLDWPPA